MTRLALAGKCGDPSTPVEASALLQISRGSSALRARLPRPRLAFERKCRRVNDIGCKGSRLFMVASPMQTAKMTLPVCHLSLPRLANSVFYANLGGDKTYASKKMSLPVCHAF